MTLRPLGRRVLVRPVQTPVSTILELTDETAPQQGDVVAVGQAHCPDCRSPLQIALQPHMRVAIRPTAIVQDVTLLDETYWVVDLDDVLAEILPVEEPVHAE